MTLLKFFLKFLQELKFAVHAHPTLSEVVDELYKAAKVSSNVLWVLKYVQKDW